MRAACAHRGGRDRQPLRSAPRDVAPRARPRQGGSRLSVASAELSIVVPIFNEAPNVEPLVAELRATLERLDRSAEVVLVDDGSGDDTFALAAEVTAGDPRFRVVRLRRNFGQTAALAAGIDHASGATIVTMDGDLQNDPADIPRLLEVLDEGHDVVVGWRYDRQDAFLSRTLPSRLANAIIGAVTSVDIHDHGCGLKAFRGDVARSLRLYGEMHRFIAAIAGDLGATVVEIPVNHRPRRRGQSKYGLSRTVRVVLDLVTIKFLSGFATRPIHFFGTAGLLTTVVGLGITGVLGVERLLFGVQLAGRPLLLLGILMVLGGVQLVTLGLLGEMLARTYHESQGKPIYRVREIQQSAPAPPSLQKQV